MNQPSGQLIRCTCCGDDTNEATSYVDPDLHTPVCPDCKIALRWAKARLEDKTGMKGCIQHD